MTSPLLDGGDLVHFTGEASLSAGLFGPVHNPFGSTKFEPNLSPAPPEGFTPEVSGQVSGGLAQALKMVGTPYTWGGSSAATGVDCSGLVYMFLKGAGANVARVRARDYGRMGQQIDGSHARPGDIVYYDEPGDTDHVGIYLGNGMMLQAPQSGDVVKISPVGHATSFRRILPDRAWAGMTTDPIGRTVWNYGGQTYRGG